MDTKIKAMFAGFLSIAGFISSCGDDELKTNNQAGKALNIVKKSSILPIETTIKNPQSMTLSTQDRVSAN
jgi:hypothetical protein